MPTPSDLRVAVADVSMLAADDLDLLWRQVSNGDEAREALEDVLPVLVRTYGLAAAAAAADWYDDLRDALSIDGRFFAIVSDINDRGADALARWAVSPLFDTEPDFER